MTRSAMTRREALKIAAGVAGALVGLGGVVGACGGDTGPGGGEPGGGDSGGGDSGGGADAPVDDGAASDGGGNAQDTGGPDAPATDAAPNACLTNGAKNGVLFNGSDGSGHALVVPVADVKAGVVKTYNIQGASSHPHSITLTVANFVTLQQGMTVTVKSTTNSGHSHMVPVICA